MHRGPSCKSVRVSQAAEKSRRVCTHLLLSKSSPQDTSTLKYQLPSQLPSHGTERNPQTLNVSTVLSHSKRPRMEWGKRIQRPYGTRITRHQSKMNGTQQPGLKRRTVEERKKQQAPQKQHPGLKRRAGKAHMQNGHLGLQRCTGTKPAIRQTR